MYTCYGTYYHVYTMCVYTCMSTFHVCLFQHTALLTVILVCLELKY